MKASELVLAQDGSLYHIRLTSDTLADRVLLVGDPGRVDMFKEIFDSVEFEAQNREIHALTGRYHGTRMTALSTGMGCDNIDIVMTELDAALRIGRRDNEEGGMRNEKLGGAEANSTFNIQHSSLIPTLKIVRIGTSGSLQADIDCGSHVAAQYAIGLDGLMNYYREWDSPLPAMERELLPHLGLAPALARPYCVAGSSELLAKVAPDMHHGITATAPGFYGPQGRTIRLHPAIANLNERLAAFSYDGVPVTNLEMETSAIYGFSHLLGHQALTVCLIIANRPRGTFLNDYHPQMRELVGTVVERLT